MKMKPKLHGYSSVNVGNEVFIFKPDKYTFYK
ncbi:hypothetical protein EDF67_101228 [Sphingobacterium sp. JUb78]|nr:hypothetical protein [Sphingobacterium kitahiroshimense]TCR14125.1 hypothetical protein EDF67_101228 [Sphingobacterium sp. JUb78]